MLKPLAAGSLLVVAFLGVGGAASAAPPPEPEARTAAAVVSTGVNDFRFESFSADYYLDVDADGRSTLTTVETLVAVFPEFDQNRGIRRAIPEHYLGEPTDIQVVSVTDGEGNPRPYEVESDEGFRLVTSAASSYVHGHQTYVITYTQRNVTRYFENDGADEFFWDTNGTGWDQPFGMVSVRIHIPKQLAASLNGDSACYQGYQGSTQRCDDLTRTDGPDETVFATRVADLLPRQNVTVAIGFEPGTFVPRDNSYFGSPHAIPQLIGLALAALAAIWALVLRFGRLADGRGRPTIIAEYAPPKGLDLFTAAAILGRTSKGAAAQFIDLAVRRHIRIIETPKTGFFASGNTYVLELLDPTGLEGPPLKLAHALFGHQLQPGTGYRMSSRDIRLSQAVRSIVQGAASATKSRGLRKGPGGVGLLPAVLAIGGGVATVMFGAMMLDNSSGGLVPLLLMAIPVVGFFIVFSTVFRSPLTDKGAELRDHLKGLEMYIRLAETDRMRVLHSPSGAERTPVAADDPGEVIKIYEKLLPYAVLFGLEKEWAQELGRYYTEESPEWYSGSGAFNAALFATSIHAMSSTVATSYSGSSSSSSSGGSGGGGSSGGGGGGGGGGGV